MQQELSEIALSAAHETVLDYCEEKVIVQGRELQMDMLTKSVTCCVESAGTKGRRCSSVAAVGVKKPRALVSSIGVIGIKRRYWQCRSGSDG